MDRNVFLSRTDIIERVMAERTACSRSEVQAALSRCRCEGCDKALPETGTAKIAIVVVGHSLVTYGKCCSGKINRKTISGMGALEFSLFVQKIMGGKHQRHLVIAEGTARASADDSKPPFCRVSPALFPRRHS